MPRAFRCCLLLVAACAGTSGTVKPHLSAGYAKLDAKDYVGAEAEFRTAQKRLADEPSDRAAEAVVDGMARADVGLIGAAVRAQAETAGDDLAAIAELHRLHLRLREIGGDATVEAKLVEGINIHASLLLAPHEAAADLTDVRPVLEIGKYPELSDDTRKRLSVLSARAWRTFEDRAARAPSPLVKRTFEGLAAHYSGAALPDAHALRDAELASYTRGSQVAATVAPGCPVAADAFAALVHAGKYQVDATVSIAQCSTDHRSSSAWVDQPYMERIPYQVEEEVPHLSCGEVIQHVAYCVNPYLGNGCVSSSETVKSYQCQTVVTRELVTRYREVPATRKVLVTTTYDTDHAALAWTRTFDGKTEQLTDSITAERVNGSGDTIQAVAVARLRRSLDEPVRGLVDAQAEALRRAGDAALAGRDVEAAELAYLRAIFLGRTAGDHFATRYAVSDDMLRAALDPRAANAPADRPAALEALPEVHDVRRADAIAFARDRFASTYPPALSRVRGGWYNIDLGALSAPRRGEAAGGTAPALGVRLGTPVLSRLHGITRGFAAWDDLALGGDLGYTASSTAAGTKGLALRGTAMYTAALGVRFAPFQLLAGARAAANAIKIGDTTGHALGLSYVGALAVRVKNASIAAEVWAPTGTGDESYGAQLYLAARTPGAQSPSGDFPTSYVAVRVDADRYDACAATRAACVNIDDLRVWTIVLAFGAGFR